MSEVKEKKYQKCDLCGKELSCGCGNYYGWTTVQATDTRLIEEYVAIGGHDVGHSCVYKKKSEQYKFQMCELCGETITEVLPLLKKALPWLKKKFK